MPIRVLAAVIRRAGRVLLCKRPSHKRHGDLWEFPGGKVEQGEGDLEAARRELAEELGVVVVRVGKVAFSVADPDSQFVIEFLPVEVDGDPICIEHSELAWVTPEEAPCYRLAPSDLQFVQEGLATYDSDSCYG